MIWNVYHGDRLLGIVNEPAYEAALEAARQFFTPRVHAERRHLGLAPLPRVFLRVLRATTDGEHEEDCARARRLWGRPL